MSQGKFVATRDSMLHTKIQPTTMSKEDSITRWKESVTIQGLVSAIQGNTTLSRQKIHANVRNSVPTKKSMSRHKLRINLERMLQHNIDCCNKVEELEKEISVTTKDNHVVT